jgi:ABC-type uncharacterized transport system permease subunit
VAGFRRQSAYRLAALGGLVANLTFGLLKVSVLFATVRAAGGQPHGYDTATMSTHVWLSQGLLGSVNLTGRTDLAFSMADLSFGHVDTLPTFLRAGPLDAFYLRPQPILLQLITSDISLRRLARAAVGAAALGTGLATAGVSWGPRTAVLVPLALVSGYATFAGLYVWAAGLQFFLLDGAEMTNAFVYGGRYAATQPASVWSRPLKLVFGFFFPMAFTAYLPSVTMLGLPGPEWLPAWLGWCASFPWPADARRGGRRAAALAAAGDPGRADDRPGRAVQAAAAGVPHRRAPPARHHLAAHHSSHG